MKKRVVIMGLVLIMLGWITPAFAREPINSSGKLTVLVIDKLAVEDLNPAVTPSLCRLIDKGSLGLCSNRTLGKGGSEDGYLTMGAGNLAGGAAICGFNHDERTGKGIQTGAQFFENLMGVDPGSHEVLLLNLPEIQTAMMKDKVTTRPGMLGDTLSKNNVDVHVLGNADINGFNYRPAVALAMDFYGRVAHGDVGIATCEEVEDSFITTRTNYGYLLEQLKHLQNSPGIRIVDLSDLARMDKAGVASPEMQIRERERVLKDIDQFVAKVAGDMDFSQDMLMVAVPSAAMVKVQEKSTFTPLIIVGPEFKQGVLSSSTTRRDYIVANTDVAITILDYFNIEPPQEVVIGQPIRSSADNQDRLETAQQLTQKTAMINRVRVTLVKGYVLLQIIFICFALFCILFKPRFKETASRLLLAMVVIPFVFLIMGAIPAVSDGQYMLIAVLATIILNIATRKLFKGNYFKGLLAISALTLIILNIDIINNSSLIKNSVLGYDPMSGARYYGIGNEYVGVLMGTSILLAAALTQKIKRPYILGLITLLFISQTYMLAAPSLGAQSDGMITAPIAFIVTLILLSGHNLNPKLVFSLLGAVVASVLAFTIFDMTRPAEMQTHIGRAAHQIYQGGWQEALLIMARKAAMNMKLIRYTIWTRVFIAILLALAVLVYRPVGAMKMIRDKYPPLFKGFAGILLAAIIGGLINDSGIVCAATTSIYLITPLLMLILHNHNEVTEK
ncbi:Alkaline phosphatase-like, alpha/beta/alpha [Syntrophomonas zehnderi OL-4]|uniref:Alkaline phosphatase-like, alpha/beta/alpha n=1 Tax=Syntrophomonas zehnderi OL-4 TaxID=690567 RepID=A0A0E4C8F5_9FIRM|nr:hypothetical protein [Syntrophomonas zehnderi]CFX41315.1 Alkaline phosphatase-like, alpha/beta/alpha [Syntrophomonas zehnderi OL-4]